MTPNFNITLPTNVKDQAIEAKDPAVISTSVGAPTSSSFDYQPVESMFETPPGGQELQSVDANYLSMLANTAPMLNKYAIKSVGISDNSKPTYATDTYDPLEQTKPISFDTPEGRLRAFDNPDALSKTYYPGVENAIQIKDPIYSGIRDSGFDRFYEHPKFSQLGWHPYANNEEYYNANSTIYDDMSRMWGQFGALTRSGFMSGYRSMGDLFDGDKYLTTPDLQSAFEFSDAMRIGSSSRTGFGASANNFLLNSGYTIGIIGSIAMEELAMKAVTGALTLTGVGAPAAATLEAAEAVRSAERLATATEGIFSASKFFGATSKMLSTLNNTEKARDFWSAMKTGGKLTGDFFTPNVMHAIKSFETSKTALQNTSNIAKASKLFGGFYKDFREVNLALSESKLEAGMTYNDQLANSFAIETKKNNGEALSVDQVKTAENYASKAAFRTLMFNAPLIYLSNKIVLETAFKGFKPLAGAFDESLSGVGKRLIRTKKTIDPVTGQIAKDVFEDAGEGMLGGALPSLKRLKSYTVAGSVTAGAHGALRYFAANLTEGIQETAQDIISYGAKDYYSNLEEDPANGGIEAIKGSLNSAVNSQMNAQGFETFMSGFLMGGIVQGPQKLVFVGIPKAINYITDSKSIKQYKADKENYIKKLLVIHNQAWNAQAEDPSALFDPNKLNFLVQKQVAAEMKSSAYKGDIFGFIDAQDYGVFNQIETIIKNGTSFHFKEQLNAIKNLNDQDLLQAYPEFSGKEGVNHLRTKLNSMLNQIDETEKTYNESKDRYINPFDVSKYKRGTREYNDESLKSFAYEHARHLYMFTQDGFKRALERTNKIFGELQSDPIISKLAASDLTVLLDTDSIGQEIKLLTSEIDSLDDSAESKKITGEKKEKIKHLTALNDVLTDPNHLTTEGVFDRRKRHKVTEPFTNYIQYLADTKNDFVDRKQIEATLNKIVDYKHLKHRAKVYDKAIEYMLNPARLSEIVNQNFNEFKARFKNNIVNYEKVIKKHIVGLEANELLNKLLTKGVYPYADEVEEFLEDGNASVLLHFMNEESDILPQTNPGLFLEIHNLLMNYEKATTLDEEEESKKDIDDIFDDLDLERPDNIVINPDETDSPYIKETLRDKYETYKSDLIAVNKEFKSWEEWLKTNDVKAVISALYMLKQMWKLTLNADENFDTIYKSDKGFKEWLDEQKDNEDVKSLIDKVNLITTDVIKTGDKKSKLLNNKTNRVIYKEGSGVNIIKVTTINNEGEKVDYYELVDDNGKSLSDNMLTNANLSSNGVFTSAAAAVEAFNKVANLIPNTDSFTFDGVELKYGTIITDENNNEFIVKSSPANVSKYNNLIIIPVDKNNIKDKKERDKHNVIIKIGDFVGKYTPKTLGFNNVIVTSSNKVSKMKLGEFTQSYPHKNSGESRDDAQNRLDTILKNLTPEELENLELVVTVRADGGQENGLYQRGKDKEPNPLIKRIKEKYSIGIRIGNPVVNSRINDILRKQQMEVSDDLDGVIAYLPNNNVKLYDKSGKEINVASITNEQVVPLFNVNLENNNKASLQGIRNNYIAQQLLLSKINDKLKSGSKVIIKVSELPDVSILPNGGFFDQNTPEKKLSDLNNFSADGKGNVLIIDNRKKYIKGEVINQTTYISNLKGEERENLIKEINESLVEQGKKDKSETIGRYVAVIREPNGQLYLAQLKQNKIPTEKINEFLTKLVDRAILTTKENLDQSDNYVTAKALKETFNLSWNTEFENDFYIGIKPGINASLQVTPWGKIQFELYDIINKKRIAKLTFSQLELEEFKKNPIEILNKINTAIKEVKDLEDVKKLGVKITPDIFKTSFDSDVPSQEVIDNTVTTFDERVTKDYSFDLFVDSAEMQALNVILNTQVKTEEPDTKKGTTIISTETNIDSFDGMSELEFEDHKTSDFKNVNKQLITDLATKIGKSGEKSLTPREQIVYNNGDIQSRVNVLVSKSKVVVSDKNELLAKKEELKEQRDKRKAELHAEIVASKPENVGSVYFLAEQNDKELNELKAKIKKIDQALIAKKIVPESFTTKDAEDINVFIDWAKNNLPDFINIDDINKLENRLHEGGVTVGQFNLWLHGIGGNMKVGGTIYTGAASPFRYHEAFHGVFRMLLTDEEIKKYLAIAKREVATKLKSEGKTLESELSLLKNSAMFYQRLSREQLEQTYYEEYLADKFEEFKKDRKGTKTDFSIKSLFNKFIEWIKSIFSKFTKNELNSLYKNINAGKYKSAAVQDNMFTNQLVSGITTEAYKLIPIDTIEAENGAFGYTYLDSDISQNIINSMAAIFMQRYENKTYVKGQNRFDIINSVIYDFRELYNPTNIINKDIIDFKSNELMNQIYTSLSDYTDEVRDGVIQQLSIYDTQIENENYINEELEDELGIRNVNDWDKDQSMLGGFGSLPKALRIYIGTTTIAESDIFGHSELTPGEKLIIPVNFTDAYNGLLKAAKNTTNSVTLLQRMYMFSRTNKQMEAVMLRMLEDIGITVEQVIQGNIPTVVKNGNFFQKVIKAFENFKVDYILIHKDIKTKKTLIYSAANRDDANSQIDAWSQEYDTIHSYLKANTSGIDNVTSFIRAQLKDNLNPKDPIVEISNEELKTKAENISYRLKQLTGIRLSPLYIEFSIASTIVKPTLEQRLLLTVNQNTKPFTYDDAEQLELQVDSIKNPNSTDYLFADKNNKGMRSRLEKLARGNADFDESIGATVFKNPNGDLIYAHQMPTYHLKAINKLNDIKHIDELLEDPYLITNLLLNDPAFKALSEQDRFRALRISGNKLSNVDKTEEGQIVETGGLDVNSNSSTYGDSTPKQFLIDLIESYVYGYNTSNKKNTLVRYLDENDLDEYGKPKEKTKALAPILIRIIEASNTGDMVSLPIIKAVEKDEDGVTSLTEDYINDMVSEIEKEFDRIKRESNPETATEDAVEGYNAKDGVITNKGRAYEFTKTGVLLKESTDTKESYKKVKNPSAKESTVERLNEGKQKIVTYQNDAAKKIGLVVPGQSAIVKFNDDSEGKSFVIYNRGNIKVTDKNRSSIIEGLGKGVSTEETQAFKYKVKIGTVTYYVETAGLASFLAGYKKRYVYDVFEGTELPESFRQKNNIVVQPSTSVEEGVEKTKAVTYLQDLIEIARDPKNKALTLEEALKSKGHNINEFKEFVEERLLDEFRGFLSTLNDINVLDSLSDNITKGFYTASDKGGDSISSDALQAMEELNLEKDDSDHNLKQIFFNNWLNTKAFNQIILGDVALTLKDVVDEIKRAKMQNAGGRSAASIVTDPKLGIMHPVKDISLFPLTSDKYNTKYSSKSTGDRNDAQMYITTKALRYFLFGFGALSPIQAQLIDKIERGEDITPEEFFGSIGTDGFLDSDAVFNSLKLVYGDGETFLKMSAVVLTKQLTSRQDENGNWVAKETRKDLHKLRVKLEAFENNTFYSKKSKGRPTLGIAAPISAIKMLKKNILNYQDVVKSDNPLTEENETKLNADDMRLQMVNPSNKLIITDPTQIKSLITSEQNDDTKVWIDIDGKYEETNLGKIRKKYNEDESRRITLKYTNKRNLTFTINKATDEIHKSIKNNHITANLHSFLRYATEGLKASQSASNILEYFSVDEFGNQNYNLNTPQAEKKFKQLFLAYFTKGIMSETIPGHAIALMSDSGVGVYRRVFSVDKNGMPDKSEIIRDKVWENMSNKPPVIMNVNDNPTLAGLEDAIKRSKGAGVVIIDDLRHNVKEYDKNGQFTGQTYTECLLPAHFREIMEYIENTGAPIPDVIAKMFAVRIPSQDKHSSVNLKMVDFLPVFMGSTGIFAKELIEISGADFDIDKLYAHIKEWYEKDGKFYEFGKGINAETRYKDYAKYINKKVKSGGTTYNEALEKFDGTTIDGLNGDQIPEKSRLTKAEIEALSMDFSLDAITALSMLGLPVKFSDYKKYVAKYGEPYEAPYDNNILDYKFALLTNPHTTEVLEGAKRPIAYEPADLDPLTDIWDYIQKDPDLKVLVDLVKEDDVDIDNLFGQVRAWKNNKEGANSIGAVVTPNLFLSLLKEYKIKLRKFEVDGINTLPEISFNHSKFNDFGGNYEIINNVENKSGSRRQYVISALITAMTDNAKERLAAKLGLNKDALGVVANLTALGVPIKTSILLINNPIIRKEYFNAINKETAMSPGIYKLIEDRLRSIKKQYPIISNAEVTDEMLRESIKENRISTDTEEQAINDVAILTQFLYAHRLTQFTKKMSSLMKLTSGFGKDFVELSNKEDNFNDLGIRLNDKEFDELTFKGFKVPIDIRRIFKDGNTWQKTYYEIYHEFANSLLKSVFLSKTELFETVYNTVLANMNQGNIYLNNEKKEKISMHLLSFLTIKAYMQKLDAEGKETALGSLSNSLIYPQANGVNIIDIVNNLRKVKENKDNFFLKQFLFTLSAEDENNKTGLNLLTANTFGKMSDNQKIKLQNDFIKLYGEPGTRADVMHILHYTMVKDGFAYGYQSILDAVTPFVAQNYLDSVNTAHEVLKANLDTVNFQNTFGMNYNDLINNFVFNYLQSNQNNFLLKTVSDVSEYSPVKADVTISKTFYDKKIIKADKTNVYVFGDNVHEKGLSGQQIIRGLDNTYSIVFKKDYDDSKSSYFTDEDLNTFTGMLTDKIKLLNSLDKNIVFPISLLNKTDKENMKKYGPAIYKNLRNTLSQNYGYDIEGETLESGSKTKKQITNYAMKVVKEDGKNSFIIDIGAGVIPVPEDSNKAINQRQGVISQSDKSSKNYYKIQENINIISDNFDTVKVKGVGNMEYTEGKFPVIIRIAKDTGGFTNSYTTYKINKIYSVNPIQGDLFINANNNMVIANRVEYVEVTPMGSNYQWAGAFMFNNEGFTLPTNAEVREYLEKNKDDFSIDDDIDSALDDVDLDEPASPSNLSKLANNPNVTIDANENEIKINNKNIQDADEIDVDNLEDPSSSTVTEEAEVTPEDLEKGKKAMNLLNRMLGLTNTNQKLIDFWTEKIENNSENKEKLRGQKILSLEDFINIRETGIYKDDETFLDQINNCIL